MYTARSIAMAFRYERAGRLAEAERLCRMILEAHPACAEAVYLLGLIQLRRGDGAGAEALFSAAAGADGRLAEFHRCVGRDHARDGLAAELEQAFLIDTAIRALCKPRPDKLPLKDVTLCCVDTYQREFALVAMKNCLAQCDFGAALFFTDREYRLSEIETVRIAPLRSVDEYSRFVIQDLGSFVKTPYLLLMQWDGFVCDAAAWSDEFRDYDYIGAKWWHTDNMNVGNGGFSFRSSRLTQALSASGLTEFHPEDHIICRVQRPMLESDFGIHFAPDAVADKFSAEIVGEGGPAFGFHGLFKMANFISLAYLRDFVESLPMGVVMSTNMARLAAEYYNSGRLGLACYIANTVLTIHPQTKHAEVFRQILEKEKDLCIYDRETPYG